MGKRRIFYSTQAAQLKEIRAAAPERFTRWAYSCEQETLRRLDDAFLGFFRRVKAGEVPGHPRFKGRGRWNSIEWPENGHACLWDSVPHPTVTRVKLQGIGHVRVHQHRPVRGIVKRITVRRELGRWYVILTCDDVPVEALAPTGAVVGIDLGVMSFLTTSDGKHVPNPRPHAAITERLAAANRKHSRKKLGSNRRRKATRRVAALYGKARRQRLDHAHKTALALVRDHDVIVHEALKIANMTRRPKPRPVGDGTFEPNGAAAKAGLNRSIKDAGWGNFLRILAAKAEWAGRTVVAVNPQNTSQRCAQCGHVAKGNRASQAVFRCLSCGHEAHADVNAAINILRAGLARQAIAA